MIKVPQTREEVKRYGPALLLFGWLVTVLLGVAARCRPLYRALLRWGIKVYDAKAKRQVQGADQNAIRLRFMLMFEQRATWDEISPILKAYTDPSTLFNQTQSLVGLYWLNARFDEMRQVIEYWKSLPEEWVLENSNKARKAQQIRRSIPDLPLEQRGDAYWEAGKLGSFYVNHYRSSRIASALMKLSKENRDKKARKTVESARAPRNPVHFARVEFDEDFARNVGVNNKTFDRIVRDAERIPEASERADQ